MPMKLGLGHCVAQQCHTTVLLGTVPCAQMHPASGVARELDRVPGQGQGTGLAAGLASSAISAPRWSRRGVYLQAMKNKWGGFICHIMPCCEKQTKARTAFRFETSLFH